MSTPLQYQSNAILNAVDDGACSAVIALYDAGKLEKLNFSRRDDILEYFKLVGVTNQPTIDYWMEYVK